jgi:hypothetical protein
MAISRSKKTNYRSKKRNYHSKKRNSRTKKHNSRYSRHSRYTGLCHAVTNSTGGFDWPKDNGCVEGTHKSIVLPKGTIIDRFGSEYGQFIALPETSYDERAIPYMANTDDCETKYKQTYNNTNTNPDNNYHQYEIISNEGLRVDECEIAPSFGHGGKKHSKQFFSKDNMLILLQNNIIKEIPRPLHYPSWK